MSGKRFRDATHSRNTSEMVCRVCSTSSVVLAMGPDPLLLSRSHKSRRPFSTFASAPRFIPPVPALRTSYMVFWAVGDSTNVKLHVTPLAASPRAGYDDHGHHHLAPPVALQRHLSAPPQLAPRLNAVGADPVWGAHRAAGTSGALLRSGFGRRVVIRARTLYGMGPTAPHVVPSLPHLYSFSHSYLLRIYLTMSAPVNEKAVYTLNPPAGNQMPQPAAPGYTPQSPPAGYPGSPPAGYPASPGTPGGYPAGPPAANLGAQYQNELLARCARGQHDVTRKYGMCGIITAIVCFPCGLICLFTDSKKRCARCGEPCEN